MQRTLLGRINSPLATKQHELFLLPHIVLFKYHAPVVNVENKVEARDLKGASGKVRHMT
jgi:hypothetical protein